MTGESSNDAGGWMYRRKGEMTGACVVCDVVCMSRDITPTQSRVPVFVLTRLCANAEIGVPRGRIAMSPVQLFCVRSVSVSEHGASCATMVGRGFLPQKRSKRLAPS